MSHRHAIANPSAQQTSTLLIAAPPLSNQRVLIHSIYVSSDTELAVSLEYGTTQAFFWKMYVGARGGCNLVVERPLPMGQGVDYSTSAVGNVFIDVEYEYEAFEE